MEFSVKLGNIIAGICLAVISGFAHAQDMGSNPGLPTAASFYTGNPQSLESRSFELRSFDSSLKNNPPDDLAGYLLAANDGNGFQGSSDIASATPAAQFEPPWMSGSKAHEYLGLGTVIFAGLTAMTAPGEAEHGAKTAPRQTSGTTHTRFARTTGALALATVITGLIVHWDDFYFTDGIADPDVQHVLLAGTGAAMMLYAIEKSAKSTVPTSHSGLAVAGAGAMLVAIKITW